MFRTGSMIFLVACIIIPFSNAITGPVSNEINSTASGSGSGMWVGSGFNSVDYCGQDTSDSQADINPDSITRLPIRVWVMGEVALLSLVLSRQVKHLSDCEMFQVFLFFLSIVFLVYWVLLLSWS